MNSASWPTRIVAALIAWRWPLLGLGICLGLVAIPGSRQLDFDRSIENMFAADDPLLEPYRLLQRTFGASEMALLTYTDPAWTTPTGLDRLRHTEQRIRALAGVAATLSLLSPMGPGSPIQTTPRPLSSARYSPVTPTAPMAKPWPCS